MEMSTFLIFKLFFLFISYLPKDFEIYLLSFHRIRNQIWTESVQMVYSHFQKKKINKQIIVWKRVSLNWYQFTYIPGILYL